MSICDIRFVHYLPECNSKNSRSNGLSWGSVGHENQRDANKREDELLEW